MRSPHGLTGPDGTQTDHQAVSVEHRVLAVEFQQLLAVEFGQGHHGNTAPGAQAPVQTVSGSDYQRLGQAAAVAAVADGAGQAVAGAVLTDPAVPQ